MITLLTSILTGIVFFSLGRLLSARTQQNKEVLQKDNTQQLLAITQRLGKSAEETTQTVQKIKDINDSLVDITQKQYKVVNQVFSDGEHIKTLLTESVDKADSSLSILNQTVQKMET